MGGLVWVGFVAFFVVALVVGVRLVSLWWRTGELPALLIGIGVLGIGPIGFGGMMIGAVLAAEHPGAANSAFVFGVLAVAVGVFAKCLFNWRVYHPDSAAVRNGVIAVGVILPALIGYRALFGGFDPRDFSSPPQLLQSALQIGALLWGSAEALRYWGLMRRRVRIGLADPVVANRFLLWSLGAGAAGVGTGLGTVVGLVTGAQALEIPWVVTSSSAHGFVAAVALSLAFVPPARYVRWVRDRSTSQGLAAEVG